MITMMPLQKSRYCLRLKNLCRLPRNAQHCVQAETSCLPEEDEKPCRTFHSGGGKKRDGKVVRLENMASLVSPNHRNLRASACLVEDRQKSALRPSKAAQKKIDELVVPVQVSAIKNITLDDIGAEITGRPLDKSEITICLQKFARRPGIRKLAQEHGITDRLFHQSFMSFRRYCMESKPLDADLYCILVDIVSEKGHVDDIFPYFLQHARMVFPHLDCIDDLKKISDLSSPPSWYPEARNMPNGPRKIIFHAGPTNSGKTHQAMQRFLGAKSGVYCGPLKLLASEIYHKANNANILCDLITGEERRFARVDRTESEHVSCTVEMLNCHRDFEVAVIDEIQMMRDRLRGWAWTRALLGVCAEEVHVCGETATVELVKGLLEPVGETVELKEYKRITPLQILDEPLGSLKNVRPGDCVVCFSKNDIYAVSREIERNGMPVAVIYGSLPPNTKLTQAKKFNDPADACKVMVATDAIGMGLNLSIRRVIFYSMTKPQVGEDGDKTMELLTTSQALQIAGRAGRYGTSFDQGEVTTFRSEDLPVLKHLMANSVESIEQAGLHPTLEQIEMFAYYLPNASMTNLLDIFLSLCSVDDSFYFMCHFEDFRALAEIIEHVPLSLKVRYTFCLVPINRNNQKVCMMFLKFARRFSRNEPLTFEWLAASTGWPLPVPETINDLVDLEGIFDVTDMYLWLGYRFVDMFPDMHLVRAMQEELELLVQQGVSNIVKLLKDLEKKEMVETKKETGTNYRGNEGAPSAEDKILRLKAETVRSQAQQATEKKPFEDTTKKLQELLKLQGSGLGSPKRRGALGSMTEMVLKQGLISKGLYDELKKEWAHSEKSENQLSPAKKWRTRNKKK